MSRPYVSARERLPLSNSNSDYRTATQHSPSMYSVYCLRACGIKIPEIEQSIVSPDMFGHKICLRHQSICINGYSALSNGSTHVKSIFSEFVLPRFCNIEIICWNLMLYTQILLLTLAYWCTNCCSCAISLSILCCNHR